MKKIIFIVAISFISKVCFAQAPDCIWSKGIGEVSWDQSNSIAVDSFGNVYTCGRFSGLCDFDPGIGVYNLGSNSYSDIFISKLDSEGNFIWAKNMGGVSLYQEAQSIAVDVVGNVFIVGYFEGTVDFDPGPGIYNMSTFNSEKFICKLNASGNFSWAKKFTSYGGSTSCIAIDDSSNVYTTSYFSGTVDFDPDSFGVFNLTSATGAFFISKLDSSGDFVWAKMIGGTSSIYCTSLFIDESNSIYLTGNFYGQGTLVDFDPGVGVFNVIPFDGGSDIYILKLNRSGDFVFVKTLGGPVGAGSAGAKSIFVDRNSNIYLTGSFHYTCDFNPDTTIEYNMTSTFTQDDIFILKLDSLANFLWARQIGTGSDNTGVSIVADSYGNVFSTGIIWGIDADFDPGPGVFNLYISNNLYSVYLSKLDYLGNFSWAKIFPGTMEDLAKSMVIDRFDNLYLTGIFKSDSIQFDATTLYNNSGSLGTVPDIFISKIRLCRTSSTINPVECHLYTSPSGSYTWSNSGIYSDTISNFLGCDSLITVNLNIIPNTSITQTGSYLNSNATLSTYQWLDCNNNYAAISGATLHYYYVATSGNYAVAVTQNGCTDTSACYTVNGVGLNEITTSNNFQLFPNPTADMVTVQLHSPCNNCTIEISNTIGEVVQSAEFKVQPVATLNLQSLPSGIYFIKVKSDKWSEVKRVVKE